MHECVHPKTLTQQQEKASGRDTDLFPDAFYRPGASCRDVSATQHVSLFSMSLLVEMTVERASRPPSSSMLSVKSLGEILPFVVFWKETAKTGESFCQCERSVM
jgi:hypothetical protein